MTATEQAGSAAVQQESAMKKPKTLYVIADGARARLVERREGIRVAFETRREMASADMHRHARDLGADRPGRAKESATATRHALEPRQDPHEAAKAAFLREVVAAVVNEAAARDGYDRLVLVAPARALAPLREALDAATRKKVADEVPKDLAKVPDAELGNHLLAALERPPR